MGLNDLMPWPRRVSTALPKVTRTERKAAEHKDRRAARTTESQNKAQAKKRDRHRCRWPLCGCGLRGIVPEVSHDRHKGMGGNPEGDRSKPKDLLTLCPARHRESVLSRHAKTIRWRPLVNRKGNNGPLAFDVDRSVLRKHCPTLVIPGHSSVRWVTIAQEREVGELEPLQPWQRTILQAIAELPK